MWASLLVGEPGFVRVLNERTVRIDATPLPGDLLEEVLQGAGKKVGVLAIDLAILRRLRLSSEAERRPDGIYARSCQVYAKTAPSTARSVSHGPAEVGG